MPLFLAGQLGALVAILIFAYGLGALLLSGLDFGSVPEAVAFRSAAGLGVFSCLVLFLALTHSLLLAALVIAAAALMAGLGLLRRRTLSMALGFPSVSSSSDPALGVVILAAAALSIPALYPPTGFDATMYHLPVARLHIVENALASSAYLHFNFMPQAWELLYSLAFLVGWDTTAQLIHAAAMVLVALACAGTVRRVPDGQAAAWAAALWLGSPAVAPIATSAYVDVGLTLFVFLGVVAVGTWLETNRTNWLVTGAFFLGLAASTKYIGLVFAGLVGIAVASVSIRRRRFASLGLFLAVLFLLFAPWLVRTWAMTGTPFGLFWTDLFGYGRQDPVDASKLAAHMKVYGYPRTVGNFLTLPWNLLFHPDRFLEFQRISPWLVGGLPFAAAAAFLEKRARWLLGIAVAYVAVWFLQYQNTRFLLPVLPLFAVGVAVGMQRALKAMKLPLVWERLLVASVTVAILWPSLAFTARDLRRLGPIPATPAERDSFLKTVPGYGALQRLNEERGDRYAVYSLLLTSPVYFARGRFVGDWFGPNRYETVLPLIGRPAELHARLRSFGMTHLLVGKARFEKVTRTPYEAWRASLGASFRSVYRDASVEVFELVDAGVETSPQKNSSLFRMPS